MFEDLADQIRNKLGVQVSERALAVLGQDVPESLHRLTGQLQRDRAVRGGLDTLYVRAAKLTPPTREIAAILSDQAHSLRTPLDRLTADGLVELYSRMISEVLYAAAVVAKTQRVREVTDKDLRKIFEVLYEKGFFDP